MERLNINEASKEELEQLNGISAKMAEDIINFRERKGRIENIEDLEEMEGWGETLTEDYREILTV